jgi:predicted nucleic acid-binding protein
VSIFDASILASLFTNDTLTACADALLRGRPPLLMVQQLRGGRIRVGDSTQGPDATHNHPKKRAVHFQRSTRRLRETTTPLLITSVDVTAAAGFLRRLDLTLRTQDALHIAIAQRVGAELLTFDRQMANAARALAASAVGR